MEEQQLVIQGAIRNGTKMSISSPNNTNKSCPCLSGASYANCCGLNSDLPPRGVHIKENALSEKRCDEIVRYLSRQPKQESVVVGAGMARGSLVQVKDSNRTSWAVQAGKWKSKIHKIVEQEFKTIIPDSYQKTPLWYEDPSILFYASGCWYGPHADSGNVCPRTKAFRKMVDRDFSMLIYLSDKFSGGNITFTKFGFSYKPKKGDLIIFPSDNRYVHTAEKVTKGSRYVIVSFCAVKEEKKVQIKAPESANYFQVENTQSAPSSTLGRAISDASSFR